MNNSRRNKLNSAIQYIESAINIVDNVKDSEEDSYNNIPENLESTERYNQMGENIDKLYSISDNLNETRDSIQDIIDN